MKYCIVKISGINEKVLIVATSLNQFNDKNFLEIYANQLHSEFKDHAIVFAHDVATKTAYKGNRLVCEKLAALGTRPIDLPWATR